MSHARGSGYYQPSPFGESRAHVRGDCPVRYKAIRKWFNFEGKTVMDFGCAEGYFGFMALKDGAKSVLFIDNDEKCVKTVLEDADKHGFSSKVSADVKFHGDEYFDVIISLDLWPHTDLAHPSKFYQYCDYLFASPSGNGSSNNPKLMDACKDFSEVIPIYNGYEKRTIYRCEK